MIISWKIKQNKQKLSAKKVPPWLLKLRIGWSLPLPHPWSLVVTPPEIVICRCLDGARNTKARRSWPRVTRRRNGFKRQFASSFAPRFSSLTAFPSSPLSSPLRISQTGSAFIWCWSSLVLLSLSLSYFLCLCQSQSQRIFITRQTKFRPKIYQNYVYTRI